MMTIVRHIILIFAMGIVGGHGPMTRRFPASSFPFFHNAGQTLKLENMSQRLTLDEFIRRARAVHGDKYDYSKIEYQNYHARIDLVCPKHGNFTIVARSLILGFGCPLCGNERRGGGPHFKGRTWICGVGINDCVDSISTHHRKEQSYNLWKSMIERCYGKKSKKGSYKDCTVCDEWLYYSNFKRWFDDPANGYRQGYHLDKDILIKGNKVYSPDTCCFVPPEINTLITKHNATRGKLPIGVTNSYYDKKPYRAIMRKNGEYVCLGMYETKERAFQVYKQAKESHVKNMALTFYNNGKISKEVYQSLMNYEILITD